MTNITSEESCIETEYAFNFVLDHMKNIIILITAGWLCGNLTSNKHSQIYVCPVMCVVICPVKSLVVISFSVSCIIFM